MTVVSAPEVPSQLVGKVEEIGVRLRDTSLHPWLGGASLDSTPSFETPSKSWRESPEDPVVT